MPISHRLTVAGLGLALWMGVVSAPTFALRATVGKPTSALRATVGKPTSALRATVGKPTSPLRATVGKPTSPLRATVGKPTSALRATVGKPTSPLRATVGKPTSAMSAAAGKQVVAPPAAVPAVQLATKALPDKLSDAEYWALIEQLSEPGGIFRSDNLVSNEIYMQTIIPELQTVTRPGRVYLGVGPEQNFTYIVALKPRMVFIIDIRRGNLHTQLMYKALFEMSKDRADFVSKLFSKKRPEGLTTKSTAQELFTALVGPETSEQLYKENLAAIQAHLTKTHEFPLSKDDLAGIEYVYYNFYWFGPSLTYSSSSGGGGRGSFVNYQSLMVADDGAGVSRSYLANEENFQFMKALESKNLLVPVVGDFAGPKAIRGVGQYLRDRAALVSAFYLSNVEQYLSQESKWYTFCSNFATLPLDDSSTFIYSQSGAGGGRGGGGGLLSWYRPILADVKANKCDARGPSSLNR